MLLLTGLLTASACSAPDEPAATRPGDEAPAITPTAPSEEAPATPRPRPITIALAGDVHFEGALRDRLRAPASALAPAAPALRAADLAIVNLETSIGSGGVPDPAKRFRFSAGPAALTALAAAGIDVATMANNHALDHGRERLPSTIRAIAAARRGDPPLEVIGIGRDAEEAFRPAVSEIDGTRVATVTASLADQDPTADPTGAWAATEDSAGIADALDPARLLAAVRTARRDADVVVAYLHWGVQGERCPSDDQRTIARRLVRAGADVVAGTHAHRLQGDGRLGAGYVAYGLGNFAWYSPGSTGVLTLTLRPPSEPAGRARVTGARWWPAEIGADGLATRVRGSAAEEFDAERTALRACAGLPAG